MEICHGWLGTSLTRPGQVTSPSPSIAALPQEDSVVHPVTYMQKGKMILILATFSAARKCFAPSHSGIPFISDPITLYPNKRNRFM